MGAGSVTFSILVPWSGILSSVFTVISFTTLGLSMQL